LLEKARGHVNVRVTAALTSIESLAEDGVAVCRVRDLHPLEAVSTAAEASNANGDNWVAVGVGIAASTESRVEEGAPSGVGDIRCTDSYSRVAGLKGARNSRGSENSDGREGGEELGAEHDDCW